MESRALVLNVFRPSTETVNPTRFAGRSNEVFSLLDGILTDGACPLIYGDRGLGKSSLAYQIARIGLGDNELLELLGKPMMSLKADELFLPIWYTCSDEIKTKSDLLESMISTSKGYSDLGYIKGNNVKEIFDNGDIRMSELRYEVNKKLRNENGRDLSELKPDDQFHHVLNLLKSKYKKKIIFFIDEIDRVHNTSGMAGFIKNFSSNDCKFVLIGVANNISSLLKDHNSVERQLLPVRVDEMDDKELAEIITKTQLTLQKNNTDIKFDKEAINILVKSADGFPWFIHVLGQESIMIMWNDNRKSVEVNDVEHAIAKLSKSRFSQSFSDLYNKAIKDSRNREIVLRLMAKWKGDDVPLSDIYRLAKALKVTNPSTYKADLMTTKCNKIIYTPVSTGNNVIRFQNTMFKRYINLRQSLYTDVATDVHKVYSENGYSKPN